MREDTTKTHVLFVHGRDDKGVPFGHLALYKEKLPRATFRGFDGLGHQFGNDLSEVARDIEKSLRTSANSGQETGLPSELAAPARRALVGAGYRRLEQLAGHQESEISRLHGMGPRALGQLRCALAERGLSFAGGKEQGQRADSDRIPGEAP